MRRAKLVKYETEFVSKCKKLNLPIKYEEDGCPCILPKGKFRKIVKVVPWGDNEFGVLILAEHRKTMTSLVKKIEKVIPHKDITKMVLLDEEAEVIILNLNNISKLIRPLSLRQKKVLSAEHKKRLLNGLAKSRAKKANK